LNRFQYAVRFEPDAAGGYVVTCRDLPQLVTQGETIADATAAAIDAMDEVFAAYMLKNLRFPHPTAARRGEQMIAPPAPTLEKAASYDAEPEAHSLP
jgi:antitoxin HicB